MLSIPQQMLAEDAFSQWLGITILEERLGYCKIAMTLTEEMTNGFKMAHGGVTFSFADSAFAFASNSYGPQAVSIQTSISHTRPVQIGDRIFAEAIEENRGRKLAQYRVDVTNEAGKIVALFKGTVFYTGKEHTT